MSNLTRSVESKIRTVLPENYVLLLVGWTEENTHFVALFASLPTSNTCEYRTFLLGFSPFEDEESQNAGQYVSYSTYVL